MHFVIVGSGRVGRTLGTYLANRDHSVALIDKSPEAFRRVERHENLTTLLGIGFDKKVLESARIQEADGVAAVTSGDNSNIVVARIAKETYKVPHVAARIYDSARASVYQRLGVATVASVSWSTDQFIKRLAPENDVTDWIDPSGNFVIVERLLPAHWAGKTLEALYVKDQFSPLVVSHIGVTKLASPTLKAHQDDRMFIACNKHYLAQLDELLAKGESE